MSDDFRRIYRSLDRHVEPDDEALQRLTKWLQVERKRPRRHPLRIWGPVAGAAAVAAAVILLVTLLPKRPNLPVDNPSAVSTLPSGFQTGSSQGSDPFGDPSGNPSGGVSTSGQGTTATSGTGDTTLPGTTPPTGSSGTGTTQNDPLANAPRYIGYRLEDGSGSVVKAAARGAFPAAQRLSLATRPAFSQMKRGAANMGNAFVGQAFGITLLLENRQRDAIVDVLIDDSEYGQNNVYSTSATQYKIVRVDTQYNAQRRTYVTEVELRFPASKKAGTRTISIEEIGFLRSYGGANHRGKCDMDDNAVQSFRYNVIEHPLVAEGFTILNSAKDLELVRQDLDGKFALARSLDLQGAEWTPIGTAEAPFTGIFDGGGFTISNYTITKAPAKAENGVGFFGNATGTIRNLTVDGTIRLTKSAMIGGVVGTNANRKEIDKLTLTQCHNTGDITGVGSIGGILGGVAYEPIIEQCSNTGKLSSSSAEATQIGGIASVCLDTNSGLYTPIYPLFIPRECFNAGDITVENGIACGLVVQGQLESCYNLGTITARKGEAYGLKQTTGMEYSSIYGCYNAGAVTAPTAAGISLYPPPHYAFTNTFFNVHWYKSGSATAPFIGASDPATDKGCTVYTRLEDMYNLADKLSAFKNVSGRPPKLQWEK